MAVKILPFDPQDAINAYLQKHPQTSGLDQKIIDTVATFFGGQTFAEAAIDTFVQLKLPKMKPDEQRLIRIRLTGALIDCAERKPIPKAKL